MKAIILSLIVLIASNLFAQEKLEKVRKNQIEIGIYSTNFFDKTGFSFPRFKKGPLMVHDILDNLSLSYKRNLRSGIFYKASFDSYFKGNSIYSENGSTQIGYLERSLLVHSSSLGKDINLFSNNCMKLKTNISGDLSYRYGSQIVSGMVMCSVYSYKYNSPGIGSSMGLNLIFHERISLDIDLSYSHYFFQNGYGEYGLSREEKPVNDVLTQHLKVGWLF